MSQTNVEILASEGMIADPTGLAEDLSTPVNELSDIEVQQLISIWKRLGSPKLINGKNYQVF